MVRFLRKHFISLENFSMSRQTRRILLDDKVDERISAMTSRNQRSDPNRGEKKKLDPAFQSFGKIFKKIYDVFFFSFFLSFFVRFSQKNLSRTRLQPGC